MDGRQADGDDCNRKKISMVKGTRNGRTREWGVTFYKVVREGLSNKMTLEQRPRESEGASNRGIWRRALQTDKIAGTKALWSDHVWQG